MKKVIALICYIIFFCFIGTLKSQQSINTSPSKFLFVGAQKCTMCHRGDKKGNVTEIWEKSKHAQAYATLATDHAKEVAFKAGIKGDPQKAPECLSCHVNAYNAPASLKDVSYTLEEGISCEACHGPGSVYKNLKIMKDVYEGRAKAADYGLIVPDKTVAVKVCIMCHNTKSPTYKNFNFIEASKFVEHRGSKSY
jgi:hypothetical protein